jgi:penicillin-binding protein 1C
MAVKAMVGSADFFMTARIQGQVNGTTARRSPGSALKPFVYALAMDQGLIHPNASLMKDSPRRYGGFTPRISTSAFLGPVCAHDALILSRNLPAANLQAGFWATRFPRISAAGGNRNLKPADFMAWRFPWAGSR